MTQHFYFGDTEQLNKWSKTVEIKGKKRTIDFFNPPDIETGKKPQIIIEPNVLDKIAKNIENIDKFDTKSKTTLKKYFKDRQDTIDRMISNIESYNVGSIIEKFVEKETASPTAFVSALRLNYLFLYPNGDMAFYYHFREASFDYHFGVIFSLNGDIQKVEEAVI